MCNDAQLAPSGKSKYDCSSSSASYMSNLMMTYKPSKLGEIDLRFGVCSELIGK